MIGFITAREAAEHPALQALLAMPLPYGADVVSDNVVTCCAEGCTHPALEIVRFGGQVAQVCVGGDTVWWDEIMERRGEFPGLHSKLIEYVAKDHSINDPRMIRCWCGLPAIAEAANDDGEMLSVCLDGHETPLDPMVIMPWEFCQACRGSGDIEGDECPLGCWLPMPAEYEAEADCKLCDGDGCIKGAYGYTACVCWRKRTN